MVASYKTFSYKFYDDVDYDFIFGAHYSNNGMSIENGFAGYLLELRVYSSVVLTMSNIDDMIDWDCTLHTSKFCEFCPCFVYTAN